jgi:hypothetical protein
MTWKRLLLCGLLALTGSAPAGLAGCATLGKVCCRTCGPEQKACGHGCIDKDRGCTERDGCACDPDPAPPRR